MSLVYVKIDWNATEFVDEVRAGVKEIMKYGANMTSEDASRNLERMSPGSTGILASQIEIKVFEEETDDIKYVVEAQGTGNYAITTKKDGSIRRRYYASFVDLGTSKMPGNAFLRKALKRNKFRMRAKLRQMFGELRS